MTAKTVDRDGSIGMAFLTKTFFAEYAVGLRVSVTIDAVFEAEVGCSHTFSNGLVPMIQQEFKVLMAHNTFIPYTLVTPGDNFAVRA